MLKFTCKLSIWSTTSGGGKLRLHQKPNTKEVKACRPWLEREIALVKPAVVMVLGTTAAGSVCGRAA
ncbi:MAG: hypothetical protein C5B49_01620 [Bdellovibrio sp.]|nr:MAG: hypothetical protein C5B49_01620 [Bdellovibrio sp.]